VTAGPTPFPFIVGCGRSGTTLLRAMLDAHPDLAVPDEAGFVVRYARPHYAMRYGWPRHFDAGRCADLILADNSFQRWDLPESDVRAALAAARPSGYAELVRCLYGVAATVRAKPRFADKTPMHVLHLPRLARLFPEARFVHLIRDGRDVALSYRSVAWGPDTVEEGALRWRRSVRHGRRAGRRLGADRYCEVHYEALVADPEPVLRRLCRYLDLSWDDAVLHHHEHAEAVVAATRFPAAHRHVMLPATPGLRDWRAEMTADELAAFEAIAGTVLDELGYERAVGRPTVAARAVAAVRIAQDNATRARIHLVAGTRVLAKR
jgi:hypothetical protein